MAVIKKWIINIGLFILIGTLIFGFLAYEKAAQPGPLNSNHRNFEDCSLCHQPWKGVSSQKCKNCHFFPDYSKLRKEIRFHEAGEKCLVCHKEHGLYGQSITRMKHAILNAELRCTKCHFDQHEGLFGQECRQCHGIKSWKIKNYQHPSNESQKCNLCHKAPRYHYDDRYWQMMIEEMQKKTVKPDQCWQCHTIYHWSHLKMEHSLKVP